MGDRVKRLVFRLGRIVLIILVLMLGLVVMYPQRYLPPGMTLGEFFSGIAGRDFFGAGVCCCRHTRMDRSPETEPR